MSGLELPQGAQPEEPKETVESPDIPGTFCPIRSGTFAFPAPGLAGQLRMQPGVVDAPCRRDCRAYLPSNLADKPGSCAITEAARALRTLARQRVGPETPKQGRVTL